MAAFLEGSSPHANLAPGFKVSNIMAINLGIPGPRLVRNRAQLRL